MTTPHSAVHRRLRIWHFLVVAIAYIALVQGVTLAMTAGQDSGYAEPTSIDGIVRSVVVPVGLGLVLVLAVTGWFGLWDQVFVERRRFRRWTLVLPVVLLLVAGVVTNWSGLGAKGSAFALLLFVALMMVGFGEELLFRGIGVAAFRQHGLSERQVGLWTTVVFGVAHGSNVVTAGPAALVQILLTAATGCVFYLVLRSTGTLLASMAAHGLWDFSVISTQVDPDSTSPLVNVAGVALAVILVGAFIARRHLARETGARTAMPDRAS